MTLPNYQKPPVNPYRIASYAVAGLGILAVNFLVFGMIAGVIDDDSGWGMLAIFLTLPVIVGDIVGIVAAILYLHAAADEWDDGRYKISD